MAQEKVEVCVYVRGGVVQAVDCGPFVEVTVYDYDCEGSDPDDLDTDDAGELCSKQVY
jgi:hypothetical protein